MKINEKAPYYALEATSPQTMRIYKNHQHFDYMILESINELIDNGYCMLNHLYVNKGQEGAFEQKFLQRQQHLASVSGFRALRFLRPNEQGQHYVIITQWLNHQSFKNWQQSSAYSQTHQKRGTSQGADVRLVNRKLSYHIGIICERYTS
ncbi:antibiotic biosynthesis monooxygenase [Staphylococcus lugdunensis]|uniref:antibiotic biosynthesis monooxygenase family protein n=1 Tax=Staphylococcus TaxID=1279 RepID=UPI0008A4043A|nr:MULTISPECIES: antibiotic biosynthesis monooxygenase [Staphylococcus]ARJ13033.1 antibiotic biosynthesis monooxygenase [Staphylococcus lugdunensis]MCH8665208.1 antibiotic biosynthesis monooxygenase [Staphylococcus lugdunensis]OFJ63583.1 antibiotic biosynthesis monooxygenase [Staphylococcus sp. HMSC077E11]OFM45429.1 antibiotic biosynthesis monooxygenase [Staphylococcus sp. HMSC077E12]OFR88847.1 antibiotic biosynthesis monooxygenase [Staphylococcus sp. HMSC059F04]